MTVSSNIKDLFLLRHGDTGFDGKYIGVSDVPLSEKGRKQILGLKKTFSTQSFDRVLVSPMRRCRETLQLLEPKGDITVVEELREVDFGRWEGKGFQDLVQEDQAEIEKWVEDPIHFCFPEGESLYHFLQRLTRQSQIIQGLQGKNILLICHGGVIRYLLCLLLHLPPENYLLFNIRPGTYSSIRLYEQGGVLNGLNLR